MANKASKVGVVIMASSDGITWGKVAGLINSLVHVIFAHGRFVAVGSNGEVVTSTDCTTWNQWSSGTSNQLVSVCWGDDRFVALDKYGTVMTSNDDLATPALAPPPKHCRARPGAGVTVKGSIVRITVPPAYVLRDVEVSCFLLNGKITVSRRVRPTGTSFSFPLAGFPRGWCIVTVTCGEWRDGVRVVSPGSR
jgi:hypothetical protein